MALYKLVKRVPIVQTLVKIINHYAYEGDARADDKFAPFAMWFRSVGIPLFVAAFLTLCTIYTSISFDKNLAEQLLRMARTQDSAFFSTAYNNQIFSIPSLAGFAKTPGALITSVFPNLLGFGIGVYALIFALAPKVLQIFQSHISSQISDGKRKAGSALLLNASMGYPLLVIAFALVPGTFQQLFPNSVGGAIFTWLAFWYGLVVLVELIGVLFALGENDALDKLSEDNDIDM